MTEETKKELTTKVEPNQPKSNNKPKNLKQKLQEARLLLKDMEIKKSGKNSFLNTTYYTLSDIQTPLTRTCAKVGICPTISFTKEMATMTIYDCDSDDTLVFTSPMVDIVKQEKKSTIQELGGIETYSRRFLNLAVFEIVEDEYEDKVDNLELHDILMVKTRIERTMTELLKKGFDTAEIIKAVGLKEEKQYNGYLSALNTINTIEHNMKVLLNNKEIAND